MGVPGFDIVRAFLSPRDRAVLDAFAQRLIDTQRGRPGQPWISWPLAIRFACRQMTEAERLVLVSYALATAASAPTQEAASFNLQYMQLQNSMQNADHQFYAISNIMKTKHDTVKNTISNIH